MRSMNEGRPDAIRGLLVIARWVITFDVDVVRTVKVLGLDREVDSSTIFSVDNDVSK